MCSEWGDGRDGSLASAPTIPGDTGIDLSDGEWVNIFPGQQGGFHNLVCRPSLLLLSVNQPLCLAKPLRSFVPVWIRM